MVYEHEDPASQDFRNSPFLVPFSQNVGSLCLWCRWGPYARNHLESRGSASKPNTAGFVRGVQEISGRAALRSYGCFYELGSPFVCVSSVSSEKEPHVYIGAPYRWKLPYELNSILWVVGPYYKREHRIYMNWDCIMGATQGRR